MKTHTFFQQDWGLKHEYLSRYATRWSTLQYIPPLGPHHFLPIHDLDSNHRHQQLNKEKMITKTSKITRQSGNLKVSSFLSKGLGYTVCSAMDRSQRTQGGLGQYDTHFKSNLASHVAKTHKEDMHTQGSHDCAQDNTLSNTMSCDRGKKARCCSPMQRTAQRTIFEQHL